MVGPPMALVSFAWCLALVFILFLIATALGLRALEIAALTADQALDRILFSSGIGFAVLQLVLGVLGFSIGLTVRSAIVLLALMAIVSGRGWKFLFLLSKPLLADLSEVFKSGAAKALGMCILLFVCLEALAASAPLTGSDAMHYHFTAPLLEIGGREHPIFWLTHSFFTGL